MAGSKTTNPDCAGAPRVAFVPGSAPDYAPCPQPQPVAPRDDENGGWRDWFGFGDREAPRDPATQPPPEQQP